MRFFIVLNIYISIMFSVHVFAGNKMVFVQGGVFDMGDGMESAYTDTKPLHKVAVNSFWIAQYEVTFNDYELFWNKWYPIDDGGYGKGKQPMINVSWYDAIQYCNWLSLKEGYEQVYSINSSHVECNFSANGYRLPTEAEWEFAAKGGVNGVMYAYSGSNDLDYVGWYGGDSMGRTYGNSEFRPHPVGLKPPNSLELYDMTGNVYEWCWDWYDKNFYSISPTNNPVGSSKGFDKVVRGGYWGNMANYLRVFDRYCYHPNTKSVKIGFRVVRSATN